MLTPWTTQGSFGWSSDAYARCSSVSGKKSWPKGWGHHLRRKSLSQGCHRDGWWGWKAGIMDHRNVGFMMRVCGTTRSVRRLLREKRLHRRLKWRWSDREWRWMIALLQRSRKPWRKHGLSAIKGLLHVERGGDAQARKRLSCLYIHLYAQNVS